LSPGKAARQAPRWAFADNVTDLLGLQKFRRVEADETVTPAQVEAFRRKRQVEEEEERISEERISAEEERLSGETLEAIAGDGDDTPLEPFYLDDLASRIEALLMTPGSTPEPEEPEEPARADFSIRRKPIPEPDSPIPIPPRNPARARRAHLSTIPELLVTAADDKPAVPPKGAFAFEAYEDDNSVFLQSTPHTLTMPGFRHGPIRIKKSDLEPAFDTDNTLDWTAFQMAILGAGDFFCEEVGRPYNEEMECADVSEWFDEFGFEGGCGRLVTEEELLAESPSSAEFSAGSSPSSFCSDEDDLPIPVEAEFAAEFWYGGRGPAINKRWTMERNRFRGGSEDSLPQSPMMPIGIADMEGKEVVEAGVPWGSSVGEVVPMGYNLSHDLGDFLTWEAENVYAMDLS
ncbi:hypothetical protein IMZ48_25800, partial [Candidatus Bathyarchaeota archaeon]|nr:hypothetical protein [Candidatus Bathyarchaeota archaeon]